MENNNEDNEWMNAPMGEPDDKEVALIAYREENYLQHQEIERLKGLIEKAYDTGYADYDNVIATVRNRWEQFKTENNL